MGVVYIHTCLYNMVSALVSIKSMKMVYICMLLYFVFSYPAASVFNKLSTSGPYRYVTNNPGQLSLPFLWAK